MTTEAAAALYLAQHNLELQDKGNTIYNPHDKPINELPRIIGFNNGGSSGWYEAVVIAEDGTELGGHICSHEDYMRADLGIVEGSCRDRHADSYQPHYPDGYVMEFVRYVDIAANEKLNEAFRRNKVSK